MASMTCTATAREDGALVIPRSVQQAVGLRNGDELSVVLTKAESVQTDEPRDPLLGLVGIGKGGPVDGAENHDKYLYAGQSHQMGDR